MDEWHVGDPADWGDSVGVPDLPYMGYLQDDEEGETPSQLTYSDELRDEAWRLRNQDRLEEALRKIDRALESNGNWRNFNVKAIILEDMDDFDGAIYNYNQAMQRTDAQIVKDNKARLLNSMAVTGKYSGDLETALKHINQALKLTKDEDDRHVFLATKRDILDWLGRKRESYVCNKLANRQFELVDEFERQSQILKNSSSTLICITARRFYGYTAPCIGGSIVNLIKEPENEHDGDAIRVEFNGRTVGYVANSPHTMISEASSATQIGGMFEERTKARVMFVFMEDYLIAELIE